MKKSVIIISMLFVGCLQTTTRKVEISGRKEGDLWWRDPICSSTSSTSAISSSVSDEEFFQQKILRWPENWKHEPSPEEESELESEPALPNTEPV